MDFSVELESEVEDGDSELAVLMKLCKRNNPNIVSLTFSTKNGILIKTTITESEARYQTGLLALLCDKARAVAREFEFKDEVKFLTVRSDILEYLIYVDREFYMFCSFKPMVNDLGEPEIDYGDLKLPYYQVKTFTEKRRK